MKLLPQQPSLGNYYWMFHLSEQQGFLMLEANFPAQMLKLDILG